MNEDRIYRNMKTARDDSALKLGCCDWRDPLTQRIGKDIRASSYLFTLGAADINSEACFTAMTGDCDDELAPWTQHDRSRSDTGMINMNFNSYASLVILFIIPVLLYFVFDHETMYTYTWFFLPYDWRKPWKLGLSISFFGGIFVSAHVTITSITALDRFINLCLVLLLLFADSLVPKLHFQLTKKT